MITLPIAGAAFLAAYGPTSVVKKSFLSLLKRQERTTSPLWEQKAAFFLQEHAEI